MYRHQNKPSFPQGMLEAKDGETHRYLDIRMNTLITMRVEKSAASLIVMPLNHLIFNGKLFHLLIFLKCYIITFCNMDMHSNQSQKKKYQCLDFAVQIAESKGHRWTDMREAVFSYILDQKKPVTAYQLIEKISQRKNKDIKPASIYRSLDALSHLGLVVKIESLNAFIACSHPDQHHEHVFLICRQCGSADELTEHTVSKKLKATASNQGFKIERQILELQGSCHDCQT